ncbi:hypothetical protein Cri9333_4810 (plasmid) [Crinalium epipsammum PCC 9333]|uniref:Uncharacterized protein n=1 Tax=Crinalium epipsammum PCC 9333 TaxID=1173022 RepID=K9W715_9CYAN|nr:hypothetical protein Cri9333_4810 [Crinalium epipsammum PCC 9333]
MIDHGTSAVQGAVQGAVKGVAVQLKQLLISVQGTVECVQ